MGAIMALTAKRGRVVVTNVHPWTETDVKLSMLDLLTMEKELVGSIFGSSNPEEDVPRLLGLYRDGLLDLDGMVTRTYPARTDQRRLPGYEGWPEHPWRPLARVMPASPLDRTA